MHKRVLNQGPFFFATRLTLQELLLKKWNDMQ